ncbi:MAG: ABC transporter permease [Anaerolineae bacterium]|jgi:peptide/nickel transport system permease protein|nr:ABC transporter permease [Anaerolineae bacterium]
MRIPLSYVIKRIGFLVAVLFTAATINFIIPKLAPRDPVTELINQKIASGGLTSEGAAEFGDSLRKLYGLDRPLWQQYLTYIWNMMRFDLGYSIVNYPQRVSFIINQTVYWTLGFVLTSTLLAFVIGTVVGALVGWSKTSKWLSWLMPPLAMFSAVPAFILALLLIYFLAFKAKAFPLRGGFSATIVVNWKDPKFLLDVVHHALLPGLSMLLVSVGGWSLGMRAMMVTVEGADYMTFADAKGLKGPRLFFRYALRNTLLPQITALAMQLGLIVSGATLVETMFSYPGIGNRLGGAIRALDYPVIYGIVFFMVVGIAVATLLVDLMYPLLDPRISYSGG